MMLMIGIGLGELHYKGFSNVNDRNSVMVVRYKGFHDVNDRNRVRGVAQQRF